jgi:pimeloyl-ACP methyl ester carboxylesterase
VPTRDHHARTDTSLLTRSSADPATAPAGRAAIAHWGAYDLVVLADVLAVAAAAEPGQPVLVGHSLGALIGLVYAGRPWAIRSLVMVDPAPINNEPAKAFFRDSVDAVRADADQSWRAAFATGMFLPTDVARKQAIIDGISRHGAGDRGRCPAGDG